MNKVIYHVTLVAFTALAFVIKPINATTLFEMDFESGAKPTIGAGAPIWSLPENFNDVYGPGNHFEVTDTTSHNGTYSLRFTYEGRNGICNTCSSRSSTHKQSLNGVDYFLSDTNEDLSASPFLAEPGRLLYNKSNGFSQWEITGVESGASAGNKLTLKLLRLGINGELPTFSGGDAIAIARQCGVDGTVSIKNGVPDVDRRVDCNPVIGWFENIAAQPPGTSIYRRTYLKNEVVSPGVRQKLHYWRERSAGKTLGEMVLFGDNNFSDLPRVELAIKTQDQTSYGAGFSIFKSFGGEKLFKRGIWYYIEEEYKAESAPGIGDGRYRLWISEAGKELTDGATPVYERPNAANPLFHLPPISGAGNDTHLSFWGNFQHSTHSRGSWYIDDVKIDTVKIGPVPAKPQADLFAPAPPTVN